MGALFDVWGWWKGVRESMKSMRMDFCDGLKLPYQRMDMGMLPSSKGPLWYLRRLGGGL